MVQTRTYDLPAVSALAVALGAILGCGTTEPERASLDGGNCSPQDAVVLEGDVAGYCFVSEAAFDQTCVVDTDCSVAMFGDLCSEHAWSGCDNVYGAINKAARSTYETIYRLALIAWSQTPKGDGASSTCAVPPIQALCRESRCIADLILPGVDGGYIYPPVADGGP